MNFTEEQERRCERAQATLRVLRDLAGETRFTEMAHWAVPLAVQTRSPDELHTYAAMFTLWAESLTSDEMVRGSALEMNNQPYAR